MVRARQASSWFVEDVERFDVLVVELSPGIGMKDADTGLLVREANEDGTVLEVLAIAGRKSHTALGIEGVVELPG